MALKMRRRTRSAIILIAVLLAANQVLSTPNDGPIFEIDMINTAAEDTKLSQLNLYIKIIYDELQFINTPGGRFSAKYEISVAVFDAKGKFADSQKFVEEISVDSYEDTKSTKRFALQKVRFELPPDEYEIMLDLTDVETQKKTRHKSSFNLRNYAIQNLMSSDILFLDSYSVGPNKEIVLSPRVSDIKRENSNLFAYVEIYNVPENDSFSISYEILNQASKVVESGEYHSKSAGRVTKNFVEIATQELPHGQYTTKAQFRYEDNSIAVERTFNWYVEGVPLTFENIDEAIDALKYFASTAEIKKLKSISDEKKEEALISFWKDHDPTPETSVNEARINYYERITEANDKFFGIRKPGWKTDMGMVYTYLGPPDVVERNQNDQTWAHKPGRTMKASRVWIYYKHNREFLFLDEHGFGEFRLQNPRTLYEIIE